VDGYGLARENIGQGVHRMISQDSEHEVRHERGGVLRTAGGSGGATHPVTDDVDD